MSTKESSSKEQFEYFKIGTIVTLKTHPLSFQENGLIDYHISHIPPFMCIKELHIEEKKQLYSPETGEQTADKVKYLCVYFNQQRSLFEEKLLYHSMLLELSDDKLIFHNQGLPNDENQTLKEETLGLTVTDFEYGKRVFFKTYKLEKRKKFKNSKASTVGEQFKIAMTHTSPAFVIRGTKKNETQNLFYEKNGKPKRIVADILVKVLWYNSYQEKMSEDYQPKEFFTDNEEIFKDTKKLETSS
ncbi:MAG: hypothetical protein ABJG41_08725 [Cyclobacteriaceae bacterium]